MTYHQDHLHASYPRKRRVWPWVLLGLGLALLLCGGGSVLALAGTGAAINEGVKAVESEAADRTADVDITKCARGDLPEMIEIGYTVVNSGDASRTYMPAFEIVGPDGVVSGQGADVTSDLAPGETYKGKAYGSTTVAKGKLTCRLASA